MKDRATAQFAAPQDAVEQYEKGFMGAFTDASAALSLAQTIKDQGGSHLARQAIKKAGLWGQGGGRVSLPYLAAQTLYPGCLPGGQQLRGDCVSFSTRTAALVSYCAALLYGDNDERYVAPPVSAEARQSATFSTESFYWYRGYDGDGWSCAAAAEVAITKAGLVLRKPYPELSLDLTEYDPQTAGEWGRNSPPPKVQEMTRQYPCTTATTCHSWEEVRDMLASGFGISTCGSEAWGSERDDWGVCKRSNKTWHHAIAAIAVDDRPETHKRYGCGLVLLCNSWGPYVTGEDKVQGTQHKIPAGSFWTKWTDCSNRYYVALATGEGWKGVKLPDWGLGGIV